MAFFRLQVKSIERTQFIDITPEVKSFVSQAGIDEGLCLVYVPHTTAGITINENADPSVVKDILTVLNKIIPYNERYSHEEGNSDAHIKSSLMGSSVTLPIQAGGLVFGTWQGIFFCEFDGPRNRSVCIQATEAAKT